MKNLRLSVVFGALSLVFAGCGPSMLGGDGGFTGAGGSTGGGSCGNVVACGGNIVGEYNIIDACFTFIGASPLGSFCPSGTVDAAGLTATGTASYRSDGTYSANVTLGGSMVMHIPSSCLLIEGIQLTCAQLDMSVKQSQAMDPDPSIQSISCTGSGACACTAQMTPQTSASTGTYVTQGTQLIEDGDEPIGYCVSGSDLHIITTSTDGPSGAVLLRRR